MFCKKKKKENIFKYNDVIIIEMKNNSCAYVNFIYKVKICLSAILTKPQFEKQNWEILRTRILKHGRDN